MLAIALLIKHNLAFRDLQPSNVIVLDNFYKDIKINAMYLSSVANFEALIPEGAGVYKHPEMTPGDTTVLQSDQWAVGCIIYELCTLLALVEAESEQARNATFSYLQAFPWKIKWFMNN